MKYGVCSVPSHKMARTLGRGGMLVKPAIELNFFA